MWIFGGDPVVIHAFDHYMSPVCSVSNVSKEWIILWSNWFKWFKASKSLVCPITRNQEVKTEEKSPMLWRQTGDELVNWHCLYTGKLMIDDETQLGATGADDHCWWGGVAGRWVETHTAAGERQSRVWHLTRWRTHILLTFYPAPSAGLRFMSEHRTKCWTDDTQFFWCWVANLSIPASWPKMVNIKLLKHQHSNAYCSSSIPPKTTSSWGQTSQSCCVVVDYYEFLEFSDYLNIVSQ